MSVYDGSAVYVILTVPADGIAFCVQLVYPNTPNIPKFSGLFALRLEYTSFLPFFPKVNLFSKNFNADGIADISTLVLRS